MGLISEQFNALREILGERFSGYAGIGSGKVLSPEQTEFWTKNGYLVLPRYFKEDRLSDLNNLVDSLWVNRAQPNNPLVIDTFIGTDRERRMYFKDAPDEARLVPYKLNDLFLEERLVRETILDAGLSAILGELLDGDPMICNSLTFEKSSQQRFHFDTFYMPPPVKDKMVASWIALEDVHPDAGPLQYYPGSQVIPPFKFSSGRLNATPEEMPNFDRYIEPELAKRNLQIETFAAKAGDVLIWHAQLYHSGCEIKDMSRTRKSLVTHYFRAQDFPVTHRVRVARGRYYLRRGHQKV